jgi:hypothetical protein
LHRFHEYKAFPREAMEVLATLAHLASKVMATIPGVAALMGYLPSPALLEQWKRKYDIQVRYLISFYFLELLTPIYNFSRTSAFP